jgi:hypothetical protein
MARRFSCAIVASLVTLAVAVTASAQDAGTKPPSDVTPPDLDDVEHMCALLTGCERLPLPSGLVPKDLAGCVRAMYEQLSSAGAVTFPLTLRDCGLKASSCGELRTCALRGTKPDFCSGRGKGGAVDVCDGDGRAITCVEERVAAVRDCPRGGEQCVVLGGHATCALGTCAADAAPSCSASGTRVLECKKGKLISVDCGAFGLKCATSTDGPVCATGGATCSDGAKRCAGDVAVSCFHGKEVRVDCGAAGLSCGGSGSSVGACARAAPSSGACDASSSPPRCDGATLRWCAYGTPRAYLCKSMGLSKCVTDERGPHCSS